MPEKETVFITGGTGLLGSYLLKILLENGHKVYALARSKGKETAQERIFNVLKFWDEEVLNNNLDKLTVLDGDVIYDNLGLNERTISLLKNEVDVIFHCAAITKFEADLNELRKVNVQGTKNLIEFAIKIGLDSVSKGIINYTSSAFICGTFKGVFKEDDFDCKQSFNNNYERSKFEAEGLVREYIKKGIPIQIFRPSIIVGEYTSGKTTEFKMFYEPLRLFSLEILEEIPLNPKTFLNLMPVDLAAQAMYLLRNNINMGDTGNVYHITSPVAFPITHVIDYTSEFFGFKRPKYISLAEYRNMDRNYTPSAKHIIGKYISYWNFLAIFDSSKTQEVLYRKCHFKYPEFNDNLLNTLLAYADRKHFIKNRKRRIE